MMTVLAPGKVNLTLEVLVRRVDGYHEVRSLIQAIDLCDELTFEPADVLTLDCDERQLAGADNLVLRAAAALREAAGCPKGAHITLLKRIPRAAGLGGGSSDAAATLQALNALWGLGLSEDRLAGLGARLGSDVPFFLQDGLALAEGRGERVTPLPARPLFWLVLLLPAVPRPENKTALLYSSLRPEWFTKGEHTERAMASLGQGLPLTDDLLYNVFEKAAVQVFPGLAEFWRVAREATGLVPHLAGSGPASFVLYQGQGEAEAACARLEKAGIEATLAQPLHGG